MRESANPHIDTLLASFLRSLKADGRRPKTWEHYVSSARLYLLWCEDERVDPLAARRGDVQNWIVALQDAGFATATVNNRFRGLRAFYDWLLVEEEISASPFGPPKGRTLQPPALEPTRKDVVAREDMQRLFRYLERQKRWRDAALVAALYDSGMRRNELATLTVGQIDMDSGWVTIEGETTKTRRGRVVRFSPAVLRYIDRYWRKPPEKGGRKDARYVFNGTRGRLTGNGLYQIVRKCFAEIGVAHISPHDLRHTSASHIAEDGEIGESDFMKLYGWQSAEMARHYTEQARQKAALAAHARSSPLERLKR